MSCTAGSCTFLLHFAGTESPTLWQAATVPIPDIYLPNTLRTDGDTDYTQAATDCLAVLEESNFTENCAEVSSSLKDHVLEACIRDYNIMGADKATHVMLSTLIFYCQGAMEVDECKFSGILDFCRPTEPGGDGGFMWWIIAVIILLLLVIIIIIIIVIYKKKQKKRRLIEGSADDLDGFHTLSSRGGYFRPGIESESSFIEGRSGSAWSDGRRSVDTINSRFFDSPLMFLGAPPDRFEFKDYGKTPCGPTPAPSSRMSGASRMSGRSMSIDITVSPTPEPEQIDNSSLTALGASNKGRRSSSPGMAPTPVAVSHLPSPLGTTVQRPKPPSQDVLGNRSIMPPGQSSKSDHPPPKITTRTSKSNVTPQKSSIPFGVNIPFGAVKRSNDEVPKLAPPPGRHDSLTSPAPTGSGANETRTPSVPVAGSSSSTFPKLAPPPGRSGSLDNNTSTSVHTGPNPLRLAPGAPTPQPQLAPNAPQSLRLGGGNGTSSPWKAKTGIPTLPAPSTLTARILRKSNASNLASTPAPDSDNKQQ